VLVYCWIHGEEWITFTSDTVEGFQLVRELTFLDQPAVVTLLERPRSQGEILLVVATRSGSGKKGRKFAKSGHMQERLGRENTQAG